MRSPWCFAAAVSLLGLAVLLAGCRRPKPAEEPPPEVRETPPAPADAIPRALAAFNRGAALLEQYKYTEAAEAFQTAVDLAPDWQAARFNLGLAHFNLQETGGGRNHLEIARGIFEELLQIDPEHLHARFCLGMYYEHLGNNAKAVECFGAVYQRDPEDPYVAYKYAEALIGVERGEEGVKLLEDVLETDPGFISGVYRLAMQYRRMRTPEKAMPLFDRFKELNAAELTAGTFTVRKVYGTAGNYYTAMGADNLPLPPPDPDPAAKIVFSPDTKTLDASPSTWKWDGGSVSLPGVAAGDVDGDGDLDLCLTALDEQGGTALWLNDGAGAFTTGQTLADKGVSPSFGDVDNDGDLDLWLGRAGADLYFENDGKGQFTQGAAPAPDETEQFTASARLFDVDSDGDLDLLAFRLSTGSLPSTGDSTPAATSILGNNRDGSFAELAGKLGLELADTPVAAAIYDDFDGDRDTDLGVFPAADAEAIVWVNDRVWRHRTLDAAATGLAARGVVGATSGDPDNDGDRDLVVFTQKGVELYVNQGGFRFEAHEGFADRSGSLGGTGGQFADVDNDGDVDLVIADARRPNGARGPALLVNDWPRDRFLNAVELDPGHLFAAVETEGNASCLVADFTGNGRCDVLLASMGEEPRLMENVTPGGHWIEIDLVGNQSRDKKTRSNHSAIGARVEVRSGTVFQQHVVGVPSGPVAASPLRIHAGLGDNPKVEWLRIVWPDGVLQAELETPADRVMTIAEVQRKASSCPHLFVWNGSRFEFVSDFGGVGGLGYFVGQGTYATPDPTEYVPLPGLQPLKGEYVLQVQEPLEEVVYFDEAKLIAIDHPAATEVYPHEMMAVGVAPPPFQVFCFGQPIEPVRATDHRGEDVTEPLLRIDRRYAGATELDGRFAGFAKKHFVDLDFGDRLGDLPSDARLVLFLAGWVEYGDSSANFAAAQAGLRLEAPTIHVLRDGRWVELFREVGYPAGLAHMMTLDVTGKILPSDRTIRVSSNMELYWDRVFLAVHLQDAPLVLTEASVATADLHFFGYPREYSPDGRRPNLYDYGNVDSTAAWKLMEGDYTRYGEVAELLTEPDDCYAIMGRGEELTLRFPADAFGPVPEGCRRSFLLKTDSFCKDMALHTAYPDTVEPLPFHGMSGYPYGADEEYPVSEKTERYRREFNTRRVRVR